MNVMGNAIGTAIENKTEAALVRVFVGEIGGVPTNVCDARELHAYLQNGDAFANWIKARIGKYGFEENCDFRRFLESTKKPQGGRPSTEYHLSLDMAKELGMVENNAQGRKIRRYFIECEQRLRDIASAVADTVLNTTIGTDGFRCLAAVVDGKVRTLPAPVRRRAKAKLWAQVHGAFSVRSAEDIPSEQLDAARNFVASYAIEGEFLPRQEEGAFIISQSDARDICHLLHHAEWCVYRWSQDISKGLMALNQPLWSRTHEHFQEIERAGKGLERSMSEVIGHFRSRLGGLRPGECVGRGLIT